MLRKISLLSLIACFAIGTTIGSTIGCGSGPSEPVIDQSLKDKKVGEKGKKGTHSDHDGAVQVD